MIDKTPTNSQAINQHCHAVRNEAWQILAWIPESVFEDKNKMEQLHDAIIECERMTLQWEVFLGAKPAEKIINIRELEKK